MTDRRRLEASDNLAYRYYLSPEDRGGADGSPYPVDAEPARPSDLLKEGAAFRRRDFLKLSGFAVAGALLSGCAKSARKAVPYLVKPEEIEPGKSVWYASSCQGCAAACGTLVKVRDGRPIKVEGNPAHPLSRGGLCAVGQAHLLELYDSLKLKGPLLDGEEIDWEEVDGFLREEFGKLRRSKGRVRFLTGTVPSPSEDEAVGRFLAGFAGGKRVPYDGLSVSAVLDAHARTHGRRVLPHVKLSEARLIASFGADFLGTWISPVEFTKAFSGGRNPEGDVRTFKRLVVLESRLSLTGSNADERVVLSPSETPAALAHTARALARLAGKDAPARVPALPEETAKRLDALARELWEKRGRAVVLCGDNRLESQLLVNFLNEVLGAYGRILDLARPSRQAAGDDGALQDLLAEMEAGRVDALLVRGGNPAYDTPEGGRFAEALKKVPLVVSFSERVDETSRLAKVVLPEPHPLECWRDLEPLEGLYQVAQPVVRRLSKTRPLIETLARLRGDLRDDLALVRDFARREVYPRAGAGSFAAFWNRLLHDGFVELRSSRGKGAPAFRGVPRVSVPDPEPDGFGLVLYPKVGLRDGRHAHNAWLQELPDPITKVTWDNYACLSPEAAEQLRVKEGDRVRLTVKGRLGEETLTLPVYVQPAQHPRAVAVALGYGRLGTDRFAKVGPSWILRKDSVEPGGTVGANLAPWLEWSGSTVVAAGRPVAVAKAGGRWPLASTQRHHSISVPAHLAPEKDARRPLLQETVLSAFKKNPKAGALHRHAIPSLWPDDHAYEGKRWAMAVDLTKCTGCSACVLGCQVENNVPVVGKDEVSRSREMHWLRIDRYYADKPHGVDVAHQPMLCQHCTNAPCETVCPVLATTHSEEGLNMQVYNRCIGTRYCANNCPYKVRRFNWFNYPHEDALQNLNLNPDVTVRTRGVMEKCSFCVQRIQEERAEAKRRGREKFEVKTACQQSCPADAIVFGDVNDPEGEVARAFTSPRAYHVLEEIGTRPMVAYQTLVRNREEGAQEVHHG